MPVIHSRPHRWQSATSLVAADTPAAVSDSGGSSASGQLLSYIQQFEHSCPKHLRSSSGSLSQQPKASLSDDGDAWQLLQEGSDASISSRTRQILRELDTSLGHGTPCYSRPHTLKLQASWPELHEYLQRRWQRRAAEAASRAVGDASSERGADSRSLYGHSLARRPAGASISYYAPRCRSFESPAASGGRGSLSEFEELEQVCEVAEEAPKEVVVEERQTLEEVMEERKTLEEVVEEQQTFEEVVEEQQTFDEVVEEQQTFEEVVEEQQTPNEEDRSQEDADFQERMRAYRSILASEELSPQLRQRLELGGLLCSSRPLSAGQKAQTRDSVLRLQLQLPAPPAADVGGVSNNSDESRLSTERLSRLMRRAAELLPGGGR